MITFACIIISSNPVNLIAKIPNGSKWERKEINEFPLLQHLWLVDSVSMEMQQKFGLCKSQYYKNTHLPESLATLQIHFNNAWTIFSVNSDCIAPYARADLVFIWRKRAKLLRRRFLLNFAWRLLGYSFEEKHLARFSPLLLILDIHVADNYATHIV